VEATTPPPNQDRSTKEMTKKDFELIAGAIKEITANDYPQDRKDKAQMFASVLAKTNERFDSEKFLKFCGVN
jgi:hypothetical protein